MNTTHVASDATADGQVRLKRSTACRPHPPEQGNLLLQPYLNTGAEHLFGHAVFLGPA